FNFSLHRWFRAPSSPRLQSWVLDSRSYLPPPFYLFLYCSSKVLISPWDCTVFASARSGNHQLRKFLTAITRKLALRNLSLLFDLIARIDRIKQLLPGNSFLQALLN